MHTTQTVRHLSRARRGVTWLSVLVAAAITTVNAEELSSSTNTATVDALRRAMGASSPSRGTPAAVPVPPAIPRNPNPFQWGPIEMHPHLSYEFRYSDGIQARPGRDERTVIQQLSPGVGFDLGTHWTLDYTPTLTFYSDDAFQDTLNHSIRLTGQTRYNDWSFGLAQSATISSDPLVETGQQTDQQTFVTSIDAGYQINTVWSLDLSVLQNLQFAERFQSSRSWSTMDWLNYHWGPTVKIGAGVGFGYVDVETSTDMTYEQLQARVSWQVVDKVSLSVSGGAEVRQFLDSDQPDLVNPVFSASVSYQPFPVTTLSLSATRRVSASYFQNRIIETTGFTLSLTQRLFERFTLGLTGGYNNTAYEASAAGIVSNREDDNSFVSVRLGTGFGQRGTAAVFGSVARNSSSDGSFDYSTTSVGVQIGYAF